MPEPAELSPAQLDQQLSNTASTSTTDLRSSAGAVLGGGYSELPLEEVAPGKCVVCLSRKNGHENLLAATRSSLARSAVAATTNGGRFSHYSTPMHSRWVPWLESAMYGGGQSQRSFSSVRPRSNMRM